METSFSIHTAPHTHTLCIVWTRYENVKIEIESMRSHRVARTSALEGQEVNRRMNKMENNHKKSGRNENTTQSQCQSRSRCQKLFVVLLYTNTVPQPIQAHRPNRHTVAAAAAKAVAADITTCALRAPFTNKQRYAVIYVLCVRVGELRLFAIPVRDASNL